METPKTKTPVIQSVKFQKQLLRQIKPQKPPQQPQQSSKAR